MIRHLTLLHSDGLYDYVKGSKRIKVPKCHAGVPVVQNCALRYVLILRTKDLQLIGMLHIHYAISLICWMLTKNEQ